ncbi:hypothetical protein [Micromonospora arida]|uniref:hypothetical protein n=1 Tax=Micromonospora arida TaxID=2203715 RepID=UPI0033B59A99
MTTPDVDDGQAQLWRITIPVIASVSAVDALTDRLVETLCPTSWALHVTDSNSLSKAEQRRLREEIAGTNG